MKIGFIGQGWIGKNYADDFENRGYDVVRYSLEEPYINNKSKIADCDTVFIAVPTPTTAKGFDDSYLRNALTVVGKGSIVVIKSTTLPGTISVLQADFPDITILHSPEFLVEKTAAYDAANPVRNIIGLPLDSDQHKEAAQKVLKLLPKAKYEAVMTSLESEFVKYAGNCFLYSKVIMMNVLYDTVVKSGGSWEAVRAALGEDSRIGHSHTQPVHDSGRGAGGHCFIKDFEAFRKYHDTHNLGEAASDMLEAMVAYNNLLLVSSGKNLDLLSEVYGDSIPR
jgi:nucleotide sugar dehydrogenase